MSDHLLLLVTPNNQFLTMTSRRCRETARKMLKMSSVKACLNEDDDDFKIPTLITTASNIK